MFFVALFYCSTGCVKMIYLQEKVLFKKFFFTNLFKFILTVLLSFFSHCFHHTHLTWHTVWSAFGTKRSFHPQSYPLINSYYMDVFTKRKRNVMLSDGVLQASPWGRCLWVYLQSAWRRRDAQDTSVQWNVEQGDAVRA